ALWMERRHAAPWGHTLSLVPLAVGLFYVAPWVLAGARVLGVAAVLAISRFRRPTEALYEVAVAALQTVAAALAYTWVLGDHGEIDVPAVLALLAGLLTSWTVGQLAEPVAVALAVGWPGWRTIGEGISSGAGAGVLRSEEHTSELQSRENLVCRL